MIRWLKILLVVFAALQGAVYAIQNIVNLDAAYGFVAAVLTMADHQAYPAHFGPPVTSAPLIKAALWIIIAGELLVGAVGLKGAFDMTAASGASAERFNGSKTFAVLGCGLAMLVWFGMFMVFGGAYFQMWQTEIGAASFEGAFSYASISALVMIFVNMPD